MAEEKKKPNYLKQAARQIGAGGSAGLYSLPVLHINSMHPVCSASLAKVYNFQDLWKYALCTLLT